MASIDDIENVNRNGNMKKCLVYDKTSDAFDKIFHTDWWARFFLNFCSLFAFLCIKSLVILHFSFVGFCWEAREILWSWKGLHLFICSVFSLFIHIFSYLFLSSVLRSFESFSLVYFARWDFFFFFFPFYVCFVNMNGILQIPIVFYISLLRRFFRNSITCAISFHSVIKWSLNKKNN